MTIAPEVRIAGESSHTEWLILNLCGDGIGEGALRPPEDALHAIPNADRLRGHGIALLRPGFVTLFGGLIAIGGCAPLSGR